MCSSYILYCTAGTAVEHEANEHVWFLAQNTRSSHSGALFPRIMLIGLVRGYKATPRRNVLSHLARLQLLRSRRAIPRTSESISFISSLDNRIRPINHHERSPSTNARRTFSSWHYGWPISCQPTGAGRSSTASTSTTTSPKYIAGCTDECDWQPL